MYYKIECKCCDDKCIDVVEAENGAEAFCKFESDVCDKEHISRYAYEIPEVKGWKFQKC